MGRELSKTRQQQLEVLWEHHFNLGHYDTKQDLMKLQEDVDRKIPPPTALPKMEPNLQSQLDALNTKSETTNWSSKHPTRNSSFADFSKKKSTFANLLRESRQEKPLPRRTNLSNNVGLYDLHQDRPRPRRISDPTNIFNSYPAAAPAPNGLTSSYTSSESVTSNFSSTDPLPFPSSLSLSFVCSARPCTFDLGFHP